MLFSIKRLRIAIAVLPSVVFSVQYVPQANLAVNNPVIVSQRTGNNGVGLSKLNLGKVYCDKGAILGCPGIQLIDSGGALNDQVNGCGPQTDNAFVKKFNSIIDTEYVTYKR